MKLITTILFVLSASILQAQTDSLDNIVFKLPNGRIGQQQTYMWAQVAIGRKVYEMATYQQQPSSGKLTDDYKKEWNEIVLQSFSTSVVPKPLSKKIRTNISYLTFSTTATSLSTGRSHYVQFNMYDCGSYVQSVIVYADSKSSMLQFDSLYQKIIAKVKKNTVVTAQAPTEYRDVPFTGRWARSASNYAGIDPGAILTDQGYYKGQYDFKSNGTYVFHGESWGGHMRSGKYTVIDESGTYRVNGDDVTLVPFKSQLKACNPEGVVSKTQTLSLEKRVYKWQLHYFEGIQENNLVLTGVKENIIDGGYASNALFPSSFLYSQKYIPEWKIK